jgi:dTDP-4-dehydrorhamnose 3,5-epimerase
MLWNDPALSIDWEIDNPTISEKDQAARHFSEYQDVFFG